MNIDNYIFSFTDYFVNYYREDGNEINVRIVDTPGISDTKGLVEDKSIIISFEEIFKLKN